MRRPLPDKKNQELIEAPCLRSSFAPVGLWAGLSMLAVACQTPGPRRAVSQNDLQQQVRLLTQKTIAQLVRNDCASPSLAAKLQPFLASVKQRFQGCVSDPERLARLQFVVLRHAWQEALGVDKRGGVTRLSLVPQNEALEPDFLTRLAAGEHLWLQDTFFLAPASVLALESENEFAAEFSLTLSYFFSERFEKYWHKRLRSEIMSTQAHDLAGMGEVWELDPEGEKEELASPASVSLEEEAQAWEKEQIKQAASLLYCAGYDNRGLITLQQKGEAGNLGQASLKAHEKNYENLHEAVVQRAESARRVESEAKKQWIRLEIARTSPLRNPLVDSAQFHHFQALLRQGLVARGRAKSKKLPTKDTTHESKQSVTAHP